MRTIVIVDFDNFFPQQMSEYNSTQLETFFNLRIQEILAVHPETERIDIRLYGGWYKNNGYSNKASELQTILQSISIFPLLIENNKKVDGVIELAEHMNGVPYVWTNTFQEKAGLQKVRIDWTKTGESCTHASPSCPVKILSNFIRNRNHQCSNSGCSTIHSDVFFRREQKMIDTMMTCDIMSFSEESDVNSIYIISDDTDLFPAIALSRTKNPETGIVMGIKNSQSLSYYRSILNQFNAETKLL